MTLANARHEAVLQAWLADPARIGWRAYHAVYPDSSRHAAETAWSRLLKDAEFAARAAALQAEVTEAAKAAAVMDLHEVLAELSKLGRSNMQHFISVRGDDSAEVVESLQALAPEHAAAIQELTVETYVEGGGDLAREVKRVKLKLHDKRAALAELRRHHAPERHEHTGKDGKPIEVERRAPPSELELARRIMFALEQGARAAAATDTTASKGEDDASSQ